jgi:galactoside O-acetyltransferase
MKIDLFTSLAHLLKCKSYDMSEQLKYEELKKKGHHIELGRDIAIVSGTKNIRLGNYVHFMGRDYLDAADGSITIGNRTSFNIGVILDANIHGEIIIGNNVLVGPNVVIIASSHAHSRIDIPMRDQGHISGRIVIEDDVWIGANSVIIPDVVIGHGAIIGAGSVVTHDIDAFVFAAGVPARPISSRNNNVASK